MGLLQRIQEVITDTTFLLIDTNNRFRDALERINSNPPSYSADDLTTDITQTALRSMQLWMRFWKPLSDPQLPTAFISAPAGGIAGNAGLHAAVSVTEPVPLAVSPIVSPLVFMGWSTVPPVNTVDATQIEPLRALTPIPDANMDPLRQRLDVFLNVPIAAKVQQGMYQGFVSVGGAPIAVVVVHAL
jgi:hypothetical protein